MDEKFDDTKSTATERALWRSVYAQTVAAMMAVETHNEGCSQSAYSLADASYWAARSANRAVRYYRLRFGCSDGEEFTSSPNALRGVLSPMSKAEGADKAEGRQP